MPEPAAATTKGYRYPTGAQDANDIDIYIQRLAEDVDASPGIASLTTAQRDALTGGSLWTGRVIYNTTAARLENYSGAAWAASGLVLAHKIKGIGETLASSTVLQDDDELFFAVGANERWLFSGMLRSYGDTAGDLKLTFSGPIGSAGVFGVFGPEITATGPIAQADFKRANLGDIVVVGLTGTFTVNVFFQGVIRNGGTSGDLKLRWAQDAAHTTATEVQPDSFIRAERVA